MKKITVVFIAFLYLPLLWAQTARSVQPNADEKLLPTKYAVILYSEQVTGTSGNNKMVASHWQNNGGGTFTWQKNISEEGEYEVILSYSTSETGIVAELSSGDKKIVTSELQVTSGYYPVQKNWYEFNYERRQIPGNLHLYKGQNNISLQLVTKGHDDAIIFYAVELIPVTKKAAIEKDRALAAKMKPNTNWFAQTPYGVMFHWTSQSVPEHGPLKPYNEAVNAFNVNAFVNMVIKTGAGYVIFTTNHAEPYFPAPIKEWEKTYPGHTTQRDLIKEIADRLHDHNIKLFLYMATHVYAKYDSVSDEEFKRLNKTLIGEVGERYKKKVAGYWFDGWYQSYARHPGFNFEQFYKICKGGNPDRLICFNSWLYPVVTLWQDYWPGEVYTIGNPPAHKVMENGPGKGLQAHSLIVMETEDWLHTTLNKKIPLPHLKAAELIKFISQSKGKGPVTVNMQIYQDGRVGTEALAMMEEVRKAVKGY